MDLAARSLYAEPTSTSAAAHIEALAVGGVRRVLCRTRNALADNSPAIGKLL